MKKNIIYNLSDKEGRNAIERTGKVGQASLQIKMSGVGWFDKILSNDEKLGELVSRFDLVGISGRMAELRAKHGIPQPKPF